MTRTNSGDAARLIAARVPFATYGALSGTTYPETFGMLPAPFAAGLHADRQAGRVDYVVLSYRTPIAWHTPAGWVIPPVRYSVTTSKHQGIVRRAIAGTLAVAA